MPQQEIEQSLAGYESLVPEDQYLSCGVHIGTQQKNADMEEFIYRVRNDGLFVLDVKKTDERLRAAAKMIARYDPGKVLFVSARQYGQKPIRMLAKQVGAVAIAGRFMPGTLTNPQTSQFIEPELIVLTDPAGDAQSMREALNIGIPIIALADTNNETRNVDVVIPTNNKGRRSLALVYWILTREVLKAQGKLASDSDFTLTVDDFEAQL
ncbi:MAG: small subunit ribosomal protein [Thermoplasmata archaeon]|jgi:small subunit ribosomal protein S2|nr:small subunit ribosomal protein [Thermoplasmata archaeon]